MEKQYLTRNKNDSIQDIYNHWKNLESKIKCKICNKQIERTQITIIGKSTLKETYYCSNCNINNINKLIFKKKMKRLPLDILREILKKNIQNLKERNKEIKEKMESQKYNNFLKKEFYHNSGEIFAYKNVLKKL